VRWRRVAGLAAAAVLAGVLAVPPTSSATAPLVRGGCGWRSELAKANTPASLRQGVLNIRGFRAVRLNLNGDVNWSADPFHDPTWRLWFHSLKWMESLVTDGNPADLVLAREIVTDFMHDRPDPGTNTGAWDDHATSLRTSLLVCMYTNGGAALRSWVTPLIHRHVAVLLTRYVGPYNHGTMQSLALLASGCALGDDRWKTIAAARLANEAAHGIDEQGAITEQAPGYAPFIQRLHRQGLADLIACGMRVPRGLAERLDLVDTFAAMATRPDGTFVELGDTWPLRPGRQMGPHTRWLATGGAKGTMPDRTVGVYNAGYVFGRDSWVRTRQQYSLRFGPGRYVHGHNDHLAMTYWAAGHDVLVDSGYAGYADKRLREWSRSTAAHNVPIVEGARFSSNASTVLVGRAHRHGTHSFQLRDRAFAGAERHRTVLVDKVMRLMLVRDDITSDRPHALRIRWHLDPSWRKEGVDNDGRVSRATFLSKDRTLRATILQIALPGEHLPGNAATLSRGVVSRSRNDRTHDWVVDAHRAPAKRQSVVTLIVVAPASVPVTGTVLRAGKRWDRIWIAVGSRVASYDSVRRGGMAPR
jgi:hypothetical protein